MIRRHARQIRLLMMIGDAFVAIIVLAGLSEFRVALDRDWPGLWSALPSPALFVTVYALIWVALLWTQGLYTSRSHWSTRTEIVGVIKATIFLELITLAGLFLLHADDVSRPVILVAIPVQAVITIVARAVIRSFLRALRRNGRNLRHVVVVGTGATAVQFAERLEEHWELGFVVVGFVSDGALPAPGRWPTLGSVERLPAILHELVVDEVAICLPATDRDRIDAIARLSMDQGKTVRLPLEIPAAALAFGHVEILDGTPVVSIISGPDRDLALAVKRLQDLVGSAFLLIALSPLFLVVSVLIWRSDGGSPIFRQVRAGLNGRPFSIVKFRTMTVGADAQRAELRAHNEIEGQASFKMTNDPRVTRVGAWLRRTSIDELPQLWNVLRGEMSLVGPRPHPFDDVAGYDAWHHRRLSMKPGMTGLWQIGARSETSFDRWVEKDLEYIDRWSLWLDLRVIVGTIPALIRAEGR